MQPPAIPADETARLEQLHHLELLDTDRDPAFDQLTALAGELFDVEMAAISLVDRDRQWFKSIRGTDLCQTSREVSLCGHVVASGRPLVVEDTAADPRFADNPLVTGDPGIAFYAGFPLFSDGHAVGTLCLMHSRPGSFAARERCHLGMLAGQAEATIRNHLDRRRVDRERLQSQRALARYGALFREAAAGLIRIDARGRIQSINPAALRMLGYTEAELLGENVSRLMPTRHAEHHDEYMSSYLAGRPPSIIGKGRAVDALHRDGHEIPIHLAVSRIDVAGQPEPEFIGILTDLSELKAAQASHQAERALLRSIIDASPDPIFARDLDGHYVVVNEASRELAGPLVEGPAAFREAGIVDDDTLARSAEADRRILETGQSEELRIHTLDGRSFTLKKTPMRTPAGTIAGIVNISHEVTSVVAASRKIEAQQHLLSVLHRGLTDYQRLMSEDALWQFLREALRELTDSEYALIGEVVDGEADRPALKVHALTDLSWSEASRCLMERLRAGDMLLDNPDTLLGHSFAAGEVVISRDVAGDSRRGGFPEGHPPLENYLGVPIEDQGRVIGMFAIANSASHLDEGLVERLQPFTATCALLINLYRQMAERERFMHELERARDEQARASRAKTEFLSSMSHELRTPLNAILGFSQLLLGARRDPLPERQQKQVRQIEKSGRHLLELINEVLDLARIEAGRINLSIESLHLADAIDESLETVAAIADNQGIRIEGRGRECGLVVRADYTRLKQVLINLLSNAIKYNRPAGQVSVDCRRAGDDRVRVRVLDTGHGIPPERRGELFQPFNRLGQEDSGVEGSGVGLALTRQLVEQMHGEIGVDSVPGEGSAFWFELPLDDGGVVGPAGSDPETGQGRTGAVAEKVRHPVLYIEDNPANQRLMADIFEDLDHLDLRLAHDAQRGLELAGEHHPALIIMDIDLPGIDGYQALERLRAEPATRDIPVLALSANAMPGDVRRGERAGFAAYLTKPIDIDALVEAIDRQLEGERP